MFTSQWFAIVWLVLLAPLGLFLMWKYTKWSKKTKSIVTAIASAWFIFICIGTYNAPPTITLNNVDVKSVSRTDSDKYPIVGRVSTFHTPTLTINGEAVAIDDNGNYSYNVPLKEGKNSIAIVATSEKGEDKQVFEVHRTTKEEFAERKRQEEERKIAAEKANQTKQDKLSKAQQVTTEGDLYKVVSINDGDTIKISINGKTETIRFIGIDTPETKDPNKPVQCYGKQATSRMQHYAQSQQVRLEKDASQGDKDKYGRLLRYVHTKDGLNIGYEMIREGAAREYTYNKPYKYQPQFKEAERFAKAENKGLWAQDTCAGNTEQEDPAIVKQKQEEAAAATAAAAAAARAAAPSVSAPKPAQTYNAPPANTGGGGGSAYYKNCTAARAAGAAPVYRGQPGYGSHLDRDNDGVGCE